MITTALMIAAIALAIIGLLIVNQQGSFSEKHSRRALALVPLGASLACLISLYGALRGSIIFLSVLSLAGLYLCIAMPADKSQTRQ
ncbi:hypothetical protein [Ferrimonas aestuarii]|uniref:Uncharacterized protein n=1 Tax=Ferrimonas aestuarii TaxID=2569539 RepID=A0A4U1BVK2_9GAMM|nr:hypothetical protein [Ferrimonas aestuarii]TKB58494.1 hypothetical protein FCL42_01740 [Ferrimonas aestuarii]